MGSGTLQAVAVNTELGSAAVEFFDAVEQDCGEGVYLGG